MTYVSTVIADGAGGFWELGESSGLTATDQTGNADATFATQAPTWGITGIPGGGGATAAQPRVSGNKATAASVAAQQLADSAMTVECWVKRSATQSATQRITGAGNSGGAQFGWNASNQLQVGKIATSNIVASTVAITDTTTWHHLVWTKAGATNHLYIDGTDVTGSVTNATLTTAASWFIFQDASNNNSPPTDMSVAMVAVYKLVLTPTQVANHYTLGSAAAPVNTVAPAVTGTTTVGQTLTTTNGTWTGDTSSGFTYQWKDAGGNIASATASTYVIGAGEVGASIHCTVTATGTGGTTSADSNTVGPIAAAASTTRQSVAPSIAKSIAPSIGGR